MAKVTLGGNPVNTSGDLPAVGSVAPDFQLTTTALQDVDPSSYAGKRIVLNIFPSVDTPTCATSVRTFNGKAASLKDTVVLCVSADLPFAQGRFCGAEGLDAVVPVSDFRSGSFARDYGVEIVDGVMRGLMARAVVVLDTDRKVLHQELVSEIALEPDYDAALRSLG